MDTRRNARGSSSINRRDFLKVGGWVGAASILAGCGAPSSGISPLQTMPAGPTSGLTPEGTTPASSPVPTEEGVATQPAGRPGGDSRVAVRFAHISDMHIQPSGPGPEGFARALRDLQTRNPELDFILNTGDCVMDTLHAQTTEAATANSWPARQFQLPDASKATCVSRRGPAQQP
jgi:hypothetical protein